MKRQKSIIHVPAAHWDLLPSWTLPAVQIYAVETKSGAEMDTQVYYMMSVMLQKNESQNKLRRMNLKTISERMNLRKNESRHWPVSSFDMLSYQVWIIIFQMNFGLSCLVQCVGGKGHCSGHCGTDGEGLLLMWKWQQQVMMYRLFVQGKQERNNEQKERMNRRETTRRRDTTRRKRETTRNQRERHNQKKRERRDGARGESNQWGASSCLLQKHGFILLLVMLIYSSITITITCPLALAQVRE